MQSKLIKEVEGGGKPSLTHAELELLKHANYVHEWENFFKFLVKVSETLEQKQSGGLRKSNIFYPIALK